MDNPFQETTIMLKWIWDPNEEWQDIIYLNRIVELSFKSPPLLLLLSQTPPSMISTHKIIITRFTANIISTIQLKPYQPRRVVPCQRIHGFPFESEADHDA